MGSGFSTASAGVETLASSFTGFGFLYGLCRGRDARELIHFTPGERNAFLKRRDARGHDGFFAFHENSSKWSDGRLLTTVVGGELDARRLVSAVAGAGSLQFVGFRAHDVDDARKALESGLPVGRQSVVEKKQYVAL